MKQLVPAFLMTYPTASSRTIRTPWPAKDRSQPVISARVAGDVTSRSICSDQSSGPEGGPDAFGLAGGCDRHGREWRVRLAQEDPGDVVGRGVSVRPDLVDRDEQVGISRPATVLEEVLKLDRPPRDVIDHQVEQDIVALCEVLDVSPAAEPWIDLAVGQRREPTVAGRRERRQDVDPAEQSIERTAEQAVEGCEIAAQRIRVRHQLGRDSHSVPFSGSMHVESITKARSNGGGQQGSASIADAAHPVVDVAETDLIRVVAEGQLSPGSAVTEAARPEERLRRWRVESEPRAPSFPAIGRAEDLLAERLDDQGVVDLRGTS